MMAISPTSRDVAGTACALGPKSRPLNARWCRRKRTSSARWGAPQTGLGSEPGAAGKDAAIAKASKRAPKAGPQAFLAHAMVGDLDPRILAGDASYSGCESRRAAARRPDPPFPMAA